MDANRCVLHHNPVSACGSRARGLLLGLVALSLLTSQAQAAGSQPSAAALTAHPTELRLPHDPIFDSPWVQSNTAVMCSHQIQDGIGSQAIRLLSIYALSRVAKVHHIFQPIVCVGHIGNKTFYHTTDCSPVSTSHVRLLAKAKHMVDMPATMTKSEAAGWKQVDVPFGPPRGSTTWKMFVAAVAKAARQKRPTVFKLKSLVDTVRDYPDMFLTIPELRPSQPLPPLSCKGRSQLSLSASQVSAYNISNQRKHQKPWLMNALRVAIHIRRGDIKSRKIVMPASYYINLANTLAKEFERSGCDYSFEVYIEAPLNAEAIAEIKLLRHSIPNAVVMVDTDLLWTWQMMASADVLVLSSSMFSASAALLNPDGVVVQVPEERYSHRAGEFMMGHWLKTASDLGDMTSDMLQRLQARLGVLPF